MPVLFNWCGPLTPTIIVTSKKKLLKRNVVRGNPGEKTLVEASGLGMLEGYLDLSEMEAGDSIKISQFVIIESGGSYKLYASETYNDVQNEPALHFKGGMFDLGIKFTLEQTSGPPKDFGYSFYKEE